MANWNDPTISTLYVQFLADLKARDSDLAKMFDVGTPTNVETDSIRWNSSAGRFEKWNGAAWVELASIYNINADQLDGNDASDFAAASHVGSGGAAHADVTGAVDGFMKAVDKTKLDNATSAPTANELIDRDASGRARVAAPSAASDIARKDTVDTVQTNLNSHAALTNPHSATAAATANRIALRDGSGRMKVVSPSVDADVANKGYVDDAVGVRVIDRDMAVNEIDDTISETTLYSFSVPANTLGIDKALRVTIRGTYLNNSGSNRTIRFKVKYGATTLYDDTSENLASRANRRGFAIDFILAAGNSASVQRLNGSILFSLAPTTEVAGHGQLNNLSNAADVIFSGDAAENSTGALTLDVTVIHSFAASTISILANTRIIELL
jgi:hypothetical protein